MTAGRRHRSVWWLPLLLLLLPAAGLVPAARDLPGYFAPIRQWTASTLLAGHFPLLNPWNGCGEAWFANPQTAPLAPPTWPWFILSPPWALTAEIALHLAWLALGAGLLAKRLGADPVTRTAAEAGAFLAAPVLSLTGMVNNLETLAWLPWIVLAARREGRGQMLLLALAVCAAWFAAAPVLWVLLLAVGLVAARDRYRAAFGIALGMGLAAVQIGPFLGWVATGDRGAAALPAVLLAGSIPLSGWISLLVPGVVASGWAEGLFLGGAVLAAAAVGVRRAPWLAAAAAGLAVLASLPALGAGQLYLLLTFGLVRYPARFAVLSAVAVFALALVGLSRWLDGAGRWPTAIAGLLTLALLGRAPAAGAAGAAILAAALLAAAAWPGRRWLRGTALGVTALVSLVFGAGLLRPAPSSVLKPQGWLEPRDGARIWAPLPGPTARRVLARDSASRPLWPVGYTNLLTGIRRTGSDAPVSFQALSLLERRASEGLENRWWPDSAGARWIVLQHPVREGGLVPAGTRRGLWLHRNPAAWPLVLLAQDPVERPGARPVPVPGAVSIAMEPETVLIHTDLEQPAVAIVSLTPLPGWRWWLDGRPVTVKRGPSVLQQVHVPPGAHRLEGRYRDPFLAPGGVVSAISVIMSILALALEWRRREAEG